jgi:putative ABC transport system ATP-binding protein
MSIVLDGVTKVYPGGAVGAKDVSLEVELGEFVGLFGPSGSGKTSIIHLAGLLMEPDEGSVILDGARVDGIGEGAAARIRRTKLGFVFQTSGLLPLLSAAENVGVALRLLGIAGSQARTRVEAALESVEMGHRLGHRPEELSGGEQQRVSIARALVHEPAYLFADEPTGELDTNTGAGVLALLRSISRQKTSVIMASHDPAAVDYVDRALFVRDGTLDDPGREAIRSWIVDGTEI